MTKVADWHGGLRLMQTIAPTAWLIVERRYDADHLERVHSSTAAGVTVILCYRVDTVD